MSEQQSPDKSAWKIYGDALQTVADGVLVAVVIGVLFVVAAAAFDLQLLWALAPLASTVGFAVRLRTRGTEVLGRIGKGQQP